VPKVLINGVPTDVNLDQIFADDGTTPFTASLSQQAVQGRVFTEDEVARIRQEEKDKLYGQITRNNEELTALREQVGSLTAAEQRRQAQLEDEQQRLAAEAKRKEEEDLDAKSLIQRKEQEWGQRLTDMEQTWGQKLAEAEQKQQQAEAIAQREREFADLQGYIVASVEANKESIAPELLPWITGNTKEEVDSAIARAVETTDRILAQMQQAVGAQDPSQQQFQQVPGQQPVPQPPALPGTRATGGPANSDPAASFQQLTKEQIQNMPMDQYAKLRGQMGIGGQSNNRGLFG
jgi:hypothetical protein